MSSAEVGANIFRCQIEAYPRAVERLTEAETLWAPSDVLHCLLLRDAVAHRYGRGELTDGSEAKAVLQADAALRALGPRLAGIAEIAAWRERFSPPSSSWWWHPRSSETTQRLEALSSILPLAFAATGVAFVIDLARRFGFGTGDVLGELLVVFSLLVAALTGSSAFSPSPRRYLGMLYDLVGVRKSWRVRVTLVGAAVFCCVAVGGWYSRPALSRWYSDRAVRALQAGQLAEAQATLQRAVRLEPGNAIAHHNLGSVYEDLLLPELAKTHYQLAFAAGDIRASNNLGRLFLLEDRPEQAAMVLLRAQERLQSTKSFLEIETRYDILKNLGWARLEQKRYFEACDLLEQAVQLLPTEAPAHCLLARLYAALADVERASSEWEGCLGANPKVPEEDRWLGEAKAALALRDRGEQAEIGLGTRAQNHRKSPPP